MFLVRNEDLHFTDVLQPPPVPRITRHSGLTCLWKQGVPLPPDMNRRLMIQIILKRGFDIALAGLGSAVLLLLLPIFACIILLDSPGPIFFRQQRLGRDGRVFWIMKFRTIHHHFRDGSGRQQTAPDDPRLTRVGKWLRRYSLDELPQLFNIVRGEMSVIGPRPHVPDMLAAGQPYEALVPYYSMRHALRPGLTGWAQANGLRGPTSQAELARARIDHDLAYLQNFSLWLDLRILWRTFVCQILPGRGC